MTGTRSIPGVIQPLQERSAETLKRILDTVERMLPEAGSLEAISLNELCAEADVSRSSFYARFKAKEDLLPALCSRYLERAASSIGRAAEDYHESFTVGEAIHALVSAYFEFQTSLSILGATTTDNPRVHAARISATRDAYGQAHDFLAAQRGRSLTLDEREQLMFIICVVGVSLRPGTTMRHLEETLQWGPEQSLRSYSRMVCLQLGLDPSAPVAGPLEG